MINKISSVSIYVEDQEIALEFWKYKMGFKVKKDEKMGENFRWLEVAPEGAETPIVLFPREDSIIKDLKPIIMFECDDLEKTYKELSENGVVFEGKPIKMPFGKLTYFHDDSGNKFGLKEK
ncbi:hypothetical protein C3495_03425 [Clostridiaceae bacterium 14S0207]|nr:hypothetical protein C3495_03425 [Clostridiaceae bacterium 14S0207]